MSTPLTGQGEPDEPKQITDKLETDDDPGQVEGRVGKLAKQKPEPEKSGGHGG